MTSKVAFLKRSNHGCAVPRKETWSMTPVGTIHLHWYPIIPRWSLKRDSLMMLKTECAAFCLVGGWNFSSRSLFLSWGEMSHLRKHSQWSLDWAHRLVWISSHGLLVLLSLSLFLVSSPLDVWVFVSVSGGGLVFFINKGRKKKSTYYYCLLFPLCLF